MNSPRQIGMVAACLLAVAPMARADPDEAASLEQVKQIASKGQDAQTTALIDQYVDKHRDLISSILKLYLNYIHQLQAMAADDGTGVLANLQAGTAGTGRDSGAGYDEEKPRTSALQPASGLQPARGLQPASGLQLSGGLRMSHLAEFPSLPEMAPASSLRELTPEQLEYAARVQKEMQERKQLLMAQPADAP